MAFIGLSHQVRRAGGALDIGPGRAIKNLPLVGDGGVCVVGCWRGRQDRALSGRADREEAVIGTVGIVIPDYLSRVVDAEGKGSTVASPCSCRIDCRVGAAAIEEAEL